MKATLENTIIAESDKTVVVEGNHYFPPDSIKREYLSPSDTHTTCPWKGIASGEIDQRSCRLLARRESLAIRHYCATSVA